MIDSLTFDVVLLIMRYFGQEYCDVIPLVSRSWSNLWKRAENKLHRIRLDIIRRHDVGQKKDNIVLKRLFDGVVIDRCSYNIYKSFHPRIYVSKLDLHSQIEVRWAGISIPKYPPSSSADIIRRIDATKTTWLYMIYIDHGHRWYIQHIHTDVWRVAVKLFGVNEIVYTKLFCKDIVIEYLCSNARNVPLQLTWPLYIYTLNLCRSRGI